MACQKCKSERVASASGKVSDMFHWSSGDYQHDGYVPEGLGVGGGDYFEVEGTVRRRYGKADRALWGVRR